MFLPQKKRLDRILIIRKNMNSDPSIAFQAKQIKYLKGKFEKRPSYVQNRSLYCIDSFISSS